MRAYKVTYLVENIAQELKAARNKKGLSQRELGAKIGVPQSHISKIENGAVDLKTSSLIELARALDLELMLVPRALIPAVQGLQRGLTSRERSPSQTVAENAVKDLERTRKAAQQLTRSFPDAKELQELTNTIKELENFRLAASPAEQIRKLIEQIDTPIQAIKSMQKAQDAGKKLQRTQDTIERITSDQEFLKSVSQINRVTRGLRYLRNALAHGLSPSPQVSLPAYRLDEDDNDA